MQHCAECGPESCVDWTVTVSSVSQCVEQTKHLAACDITVAEDEACITALAVDLCGAPPQCAALEHCAL